MKTCVKRGELLLENIIKSVFKNRITQGTEATIRKLRNTYIDMNAENC